MQMPVLRFSIGFKFKYKDRPFLSQVQFQSMTCTESAFPRVQNTEQTPSSQCDCEIHGSVNFQDFKEPFTQSSPIAQLGKRSPILGSLRNEV